MTLQKISSRDQANAANAVSILTKKLSDNIHRKTINIQLSFDDEILNFKVPGKAIQILLETLEATAEGKTVTLKSDQDLLSAEEIAQELGISRYYVAKLIDSGELTSQEVGKRKKVSRLHVNQFILSEADKTRQVLTILEEQIKIIKGE